MCAGYLWQILAYSDATWGTIHNSICPLKNEQRVTTLVFYCYFQMIRYFVDLRPVVC